MYQQTSRQLPNHSYIFPTFLVELIILQHSFPAFLKKLFNTGLNQHVFKFADPCVAFYVYDLPNKSWATFHMTCTTFLCRNFPSFKIRMQKEKIRMLKHQERIILTRKIISKIFRNKKYFNFFMDRQDVIFMYANFCVTHYR